MAFNFVSAEDHSAILNLMGKYQHLVDDGDEDGWANLFTDDGAFLGLPDENGSPDGYRGREGLKKIPRLNINRFGGRFRHNIGSFSVAYGQTADEAHARYYVIGILSTPEEGARVIMQVDVRTHLVKIAGAWKIKSNHMTML